jgi:hypothetical protein
MAAAAGASSRSAFGTASASAFGFERELELFAPPIDSISICVSDALNPVWRR